MQGKSAAGAQIEKAKQTDGCMGPDRPVPRITGTGHTTWEHFPLCRAHPTALNMLMGGLWAGEDNECNRCACIWLVASSVPTNDDHIELRATGQKYRAICTRSNATRGTCLTGRAISAYYEGGAGTHGASIAVSLLLHRENHAQKLSSATKGS